MTTLLLSLLSILCFALAYWVQGEDLREQLERRKQNIELLNHALNKWDYYMTKYYEEKPARDKRGRFVGKEG